MKEKVIVDLAYVSMVLEKERENYFKLFQEMYVEYNENKNLELVKTMQEPVLIINSEEMQEAVEEDIDLLKNYVDSKDIEIIRYLYGLDDGVIKSVEDTSDYFGIEINELLKILENIKKFLHEINSEKKKTQLFIKNTQIDEEDKKKIFDKIFEGEIYEDENKTKLNNRIEIRRLIKATIKVEQEQTQEKEEVKNGENRILQRNRTKDKERPEYTYEVIRHRRKLSRGKNNELIFRANTEKGLIKEFEYLQKKYKITQKQALEIGKEYPTRKEFNQAYMRFLCKTCSEEEKRMRNVLSHGGKEQLPHVIDLASPNLTLQNLFKLHIF